MTLALRLVTTGIRDVGRRRWLLVYGLFYIVLTDALYRFGGTGARTVLSLANVVLSLVPLVSLAWPVWSTLNIAAALIFVAACVMLFRFKLGMVSILGFAAVAGLAVRGVELLL